MRSQARQGLGNRYTLRPSIPPLPLLSPGEPGSARPSLHRITMETTLIILKPDAVQRGLMGRIIGRFEDKGLQIVGAKMIRITPELAATHYEAHKGKKFYE